MIKPFSPTLPEFSTSTGDTIRHLGINVTWSRPTITNI